jgi:hypothetical protein
MRTNNLRGSACSRSYICGCTLTASDDKVWHLHNNEDFFLVEEYILHIKQYFLHIKEYLLHTEIIHLQVYSMMIHLSTCMSKNDFGIFTLVDTISLFLGSFKNQKLGLGRPLTGKPERNIYRWIGPSASFLAKTPFTTLWMSWVPRKNHWTQ